MKPLVYMAHPVRPVAGETIEGNLLQAAEWLRWLHRYFGDAWTVIAPWLGDLYGASHLEADDVQRSAALLRCKDVAARCDMLILCGPRRSDGMIREVAACAQTGGVVLNFVGWTREKILHNCRLGALEMSR